MSRYCTDDAERDFARWDIEQARREARLPVCERCKNRIHEEEYFDDGEQILCEDCLKKKYSRSTADYVDND